jgi:hypothetical protein
LVEPERKRKENSGDEGIEMGMIDGASAKLSSWANQSPKKKVRRGEKNNNDATREQTILQRR